MWAAIIVLLITIILPIAVAGIFIWNTEVGVILLVIATACIFGRK